ncbi:MAG: hypothetical protein JXR63_10750 [Spirochaetales bacterium]|nr:hypothetical protein [Spirochaetales bacterium]
MKKELSYKPRLEKKWIFLIIAFSVLVTLSISISVPVLIVRHKLATQVSQTLKDASSYAGSGYVEKAKRTLDRNLSLFEGPEVLWIEILRLVEDLSSRTEDSDFYLKWADKAYSDKKTNYLSIIYADALCRNDDFKKAFNVLKKSNKPEAQALKAYALKRSLSDDLKDLDSIDVEYRIFFDMENITSSSEYLTLAKKYNRDEFKKNAALLMMAEANLKDAYQLSRSDLWEKYPLLHSYIAYDNSEYEDALSVFDYYSSKNQISDDLKLYKIDLLIKLNEINQALNLYYEFIDERPDYSFVPYNNIAFLEKGTVTDESRMKILKKGLEYFEGNIDIVLSLVDLLVSNGEDQAAVEMLSEYLRLYPENVEARLKYNFLSEKDSIEKFIGILWHMDFENPDNERILQMLAWYLLGIYDYVELEIVLDTAEQRFGYKSWIQLYYGILYAYQGKSISAHDSFIASVKYRKSWEGFYNAALISYTQANYGDAIEELDSASSLIASADDSVAESNFYWLKAEIANSQKDYIKAKELLMKAIDLNQKNLKAQLRLKTVDSLLKGL